MAKAKKLLRARRALAAHWEWNEKRPVAPYDGDKSSTWTKFEKSTGIRLGCLEDTSEFLQKTVASGYRLPPR